ncbi:PHP domain-containing protein [Cyanosarcina cf. burmensis CCALA 770]|jgi:predicted metal-dependent phosphoesterase TrpH|nr:PHP domain-containing protein [Cyanosarcina cf. burmensis CCALA 770]
MAVYYAQTFNLLSQQLQRVFQTIDAESCPLTFNFHMHTVYSDGRLEPEEAIEQAISIGLRGLAITDHHTIGGYRAAQRYLAQWQLHHPDLENCVPQLWSGVEINAGLLDTEVHILAYAFDPQHARMQPYLQRRTATGEAYCAASIISAIHEAGGLAVLAHPARYKRSPFDLIAAANQLGIDGVETYYAYNNPHPWRPSPKETQQVRALAQQYHLLNTCGTDTHGRSLLQRL